MVAVNLKKIRNLVCVGSSGQTNPAARVDLQAGSSCSVASVAVRFPVCECEVESPGVQQEVANMRTDPLPHEVRELVVQAFQGFDVDICSALELDETVLIDDGRYAARTYRVDGYMAMWLVEIGIVQFYDAEGAMLLTVNLLEEFEPQRMAA